MGVWDGIREAFADPSDVTAVTRAAVRLLVAAGLGALVGWEREKVGKPAGLRTHMLVAMGAALFVVVAQHAGMDQAAVSRVIQGLVAGMGFIGGGAILKQSGRGGGEHIEGLTTAAGLWVAAAIGTGVGLGSLWVAALAAGLALVILSSWFPTKHAADPGPR